MNIKVIAIGSIKESYLQQGILFYSKQIRAKFNLEIIEISEERLPQNPVDSEIESALSKEAIKIINHIQTPSFTMALDLAGKPMDSKIFTRILKRELYYNKKDLTFIIGGSHGLSRKVIKRANQSISFGKMTFPHQLMRLILVEQLATIL